MTDTIEITETRARFNGGQFDSDFKFLRKVSIGKLTTLLAGPSIEIASGSVVTWCFSCGSYTLTTGASAPSNTPTDIAL